MGERAWGEWKRRVEEESGREERKRRVEKESRRGE